MSCLNRVALSNELLIAVLFNWDSRGYIPTERARLAEVISLGALAV
jgi:hypothetical protein